MHLHRRLSHVTTLDVLKPGLALSPFETKQPEHVWIGALTGAHGACRHVTIELKARISITAGVLIGRGASANFPYDAPGASVALEGGAGAGGVRFELVIEKSDFARAPFVCNGATNADETEMSGAFTITCMNPKSCGWLAAAGRSG
jgi:hypothetical protein